MNDSAPARAPHTLTHAARTALQTARPAALRAAIRRPTRAALIKDTLLYAVLAFPVTADMISPPQPGHAFWWLQGAGLAVLAAAIAGCRPWPTAALLTAIPLNLIHGNFVFAMPVLAYLTGLRTARTQPLLWGFTTVFLGGSLLAIARGLDVATWFPSTVWLVLLGVLPWLIGRYWRQHQELLRAGWERAERLEHQQRITAERERLRERARIAQDMHDSLGHELALIAVRAGALQVTPGLDDRHRAAAAELRTGAAEATDHLREIIGVLRDDHHDHHSDGGLGGGAARVRPARESIPDLVDRARASGVPIHLTGHDALTGLPPMAALTAHRVVQEAITNATKHAPGAAITATLTRGTGSALTITVTNDPPPNDPPPPPSGGHGLTGLTERLRVLGGTLHTAPTPGGGFTLTACLPAVPPATPPEPATAPPGEWTSESARLLGRERRQVRRGLITAIAVPTALMAALGALMAGYYIYAALNSVLPPADYAALRVGTPQHQVEQTLPPMETTDAGIVHTTVPEPAHADCRYYRPDANLLGPSRVYRLCFTGGRLTTKNAYDTAELGTRHRDQENP
ncbi:sensor histidine kinase [Actinomadura formosensis]|uniref:sensor histidine kinase n=1 Tax=Actinomadura formosensis TaxID=60706 RepID=UPI00082B5402|nr:histidine kinase [Actinomadura formosensis]